MAAVILRARDGRELYRTTMAPQERYRFYERFQQGEPLILNGSQYRIETIAWRRPEAELMLCVSWVGWAPTSPAPL